MKTGKVRELKKIYLLTTQIQCEANTLPLIHTLI